MHEKKVDLIHDHLGDTEMGSEGSTNENNLNLGFDRDHYCHTFNNYIFDNTQRQTSKLTDIDLDANNANPSNILFEDSEAIIGENAKAFLRRGIEKSKLNDHEGAIIEHTKAIKAAANYADAYQHRGLSYSRLGNYQDAITDYTTAIEIDPNDPCIYNGRGSAKYESEDYLGAISDYTEAIRINPNSAITYHKRGEAKYKLEDYLGSIADFTQAIAIDPDCGNDESNPYYMRGKAKLKLGGNSFEQAEGDFTKAIEIYPNSADAYFWRATIRAYFGECNEAIDDWTMYLKLNPRDASSAYSNCGGAKAYLKDYQGAIHYFTEAIKIDPNNSYIYNERGRVKRFLGDHQGAIEDFTKSIEITPENDAAFHNRGNSKRDSGDLQGAIKDYAKSIEINPSDPISYYELGGAKMKSSDYLGAIVGYAKAIKRVALNYLDKAN